MSDNFEKESAENYNYNLAKQLLTLIHSQNLDKYHILSICIINDINNIKNINFEKYQEYVSTFKNKKWDDDTYATQVARDETNILGSLIHKHWDFASNGQNINEINASVRYTFAYVASKL